MGEILMGSLPGIYIRNRGSPYSRTEYCILGLYSICGVLASTLCWRDHLLVGA